MDVLVDADGHLMGAFGVALLAAEAAPRAVAGARRCGRRRVPEREARDAHGGAAARRTEPFDFDALRDFEFATREVECQKCANHCEIICVYRDGAIIDSWGNRCEKGAVKTTA